MLGCYRDVSWCAVADKCAVKECNRRLSDKDIEFIKENDMLVSWMDFSVANDCFKEKK